MKMRKLLCILLALSLVLGCTTVAFAEAMREDPKAKSKAPKRFEDTDVCYEDFTGVEPGNLPSTISANSNTIYTEMYEVLPGYKKNCLVVDDLTHDNTYSGVTAYYNFGSLKGKKEITIRYKYLPTDGAIKDWCSFIFGFYSAKGMFSRTVVASANGATHFNYGGVDSTAVENGCMNQDTWYTLTYVINFEPDDDSSYLSAKLFNEGKKTTGSKSNAYWYEGNEHNELSRIMFQSSMYGGKYVIDYIRVRDGKYITETEETDPFANIQKGVTQIKIPAPVNDAVEGRVNVTLDGNYKYTTLAPYVAPNGSVMVTAKNLADMFGLGYLRKGSEYTVTIDTKEIVFTPDSASAKSGAKTITLTDKAVANGTQLFVPADVICDAAGYDCTYDAATNTLVVTKRAEGDK